MSLYENLKNARTEEDVKNIYIKAIGLKSYSLNLIDIQTDEVWFEAKDGHNNTTYAMFTQLLHYVQVALNTGEKVPPILCVIDKEKAAIMRTSDALPLLEKKVIKWGKSASNYTQEALDVVSAYIGTHFVSYKISTHETEFLDAIKNAIKTGEIIRTQITPGNLKQVFDIWIEKIGKEIKNVEIEKFSLLFFADIMHDGEVATHRDLPAALIYINGSPAFALDGKIYELGNKEGYRKFWQIYHKPPKKEYRDYLLERRDSLIPVDERSFKGAYYTPLHVVDKAYEKLNQVLGDSWQREYCVWDMCCGVGNLETKHSNPRNIFMSTLDKADIDMMRATKTCVAGTKFQYDYLNDDVDENGKIDYSLTDKIPAQLRKAIKDNKKILVLINPPYAEAGEHGTGSKGDVAKTKVGDLMMEKYGKASNELFTQFVVRISKEIPNATLGMFSTLKYVNATNFEKFRAVWDTEYMGGFIVHSKAFDGINGDFPIGFLIWQTSHGDGTLSTISEIDVEVLDRSAIPIGEKKFYNIPNKLYLSEWIQRPKLTKENRAVNIPLKNAISPASRNSKPSWINGAVGYCIADSNDLQQSGQGTLIMSGANGVGHKGGFYIIPDNLWQAAVVFTVRRIIKPTWINNRDQFLQPEKKLSQEFKNDSLMWMLFNGSNLTASADGLEWNDKKWSIVNHFIPFTEEEVGASDRFESDFLVRYIADNNIVFSYEGKQVLDEGRKLWQEYFKQTDEYTVREDLKLNRADVGWYQVRNALKKRNMSGDFVKVDFTDFENAYKNLTEKLLPQVYEFGFLKK